MALRISDWLAGQVKTIGPGVPYWLQHTLSKQCFKVPHNALGERPGVNKKANLNIPFLGGFGEIGRGDKNLSSIDHDTFGV
jgi:hypothetical protein